MCLSPIGGCSSLLTLRDSTYRVVLSARTFAPARRHTTHVHVRARERDRPLTPHPPRRKSHRINVRDQRLSISYRAFLSISAAAHNDGDSKAADYEINVRFATLATPARVHDLSVSPVREGGSDCTRPLWRVSSVPAPRRRVSRRR